MCQVLKLPRSSYYQLLKQIDSAPKSDLYTEAIIEIFRKSRNTYGTRRIKHALKKQTGVSLSRRRIGRIMRENGLVSVYQMKTYKPQKTTVNEAKIENKLSREFNDKKHLEVCVSDLTYVRVKQSWHYVCLVVDLHNREIIGYSSGEKKSAALVLAAFARIEHNLNAIQLFHTDRGSEFKNEAIDELLKTFNITRSLSQKGCPYDNAVAEATYKTFKTEFVYQRVFESGEALRIELADYVNWYNNRRLHSSLGYQSPIAYKHSQCAQGLNGDMSM